MNSVDLFCGIGGFHIALKNNDIDVIASAEIDKNCIDVYKENFEVKHIYDVRDITTKVVDNFDILTAGFPCQPFSNAGSKAGFQDKNKGNLFFEIERIVKEFKPKALLLENVKGLKSNNGGKTLSYIIDSLDNAGYNVNYKIINSAKFGVPQKRERIYIVGIRKDINGTFEFPIGTHEEVVVKDILTDDLIEKIYPIEQFIPKNQKRNTKYAPLQTHYCGKGSQGQRVYSINHVGITLSASTGGQGAGTGLYNINGVIRKLVPRECARMQGFPEDFIIHEKKSIARKQFGNSVAIPVVEAIIKNMKEVLDNG